MPNGWAGQPISYPSKSDRCPDCRMPVRAGWFDSVWTRYDLPPLTQWGELCALIQGLKTFHLVEPNVYRRSAFRIHVMPAPDFGEVVRMHGCGVPQPGPTEVAPSKADIQLPDEPPF